MERSLPFNPVNAGSATIFGSVLSIRHATSFGADSSIPTIRSLLSEAYIFQAKDNCRRLLRQAVSVAFSLARLSAGNNIAARIAMMAITTSNSISVKAFPPWLKRELATGRAAARLQGTRPSAPLKPEGFSGVECLIVCTRVWRHNLHPN